jgi:D-glycero-D-manno-heptose 1,7-bisphosphate phosphatase
VLNRPLVREGKPFAPTSLEQFELLPGVSQACSRMRERGLVVIVVTNQPDVARGVSSRELVERMHRKLRESVPLDDIRVCFHDSVDGCNCRKPRPGMLVDAARDWKVDLSSSFMVGDRWRDIDAGQAAGCRTIFIDHAYRESLRSAPDRRVASLSEAVDWILREAD